MNTSLESSVDKNPHLKHIEPLTQIYSAGDYYSQIIKAKEEFFEKAGVVYEDDVEYENRMNQFLDWYIFDRPLTEAGLAPVYHYFQNNSGALSVEESDIYKGFCNNIHSIFYLKKIDVNGGFVVEDLFTEKGYEVKDSEISNGFMKGDIFEARLIPFQGKYCFSRGFCFHPVEMEKFILGEIKKVKYLDNSKKTELILKLAAMKLKHTRFQHINIKHIYTFDPKF